MKMIDPKERQPADGELVLAVHKGGRGGAASGAVGLVKFESGKWSLMPDGYLIEDPSYFYWLEVILHVD